MFSLCSFYPTLYSSHLLKPLFLGLLTGLFLPEHILNYDVFLLYCTLSNSLSTPCFLWVTSSIIMALPTPPPIQLLQYSVTTFDPSSRIKINNYLPFQLASPHRCFKQIRSHTSKLILGVCILTPDLFLSCILYYNVSCHYLPNDSKKKSSGLVHFFSLSFSISIISHDLIRKIEPPEMTENIDLC